MRGVLGRGAGWAWGRAQEARHILGALSRQVYLAAAQAVGGGALGQRRPRWHRGRALLGLVRHRQAAGLALSLQTWPQLSPAFLTLQGVRALLCAAYTMQCKGQVFT